MEKLDYMSPRSGRMIKEDGTVINEADLMGNILGVLDHDGDGALANNQTNKLVVANANILTNDYVSDKYSKSILQIMTNTSGVLSLVVDGVSGALNSAISLVANAWYEFDVSLLSGSTYNLKLSVGATVQVKWQVI